MHYWKISPGKGGRDWNAFKEEGFIAIFWQDVGDLDRFNSWGRVEDFVRRKKETPGSGWEKARVEYRSDQLWWFSHEMQVGDIVFAYSRKTILGVGRIVGGYEFVGGDVEHFDLHCHPVKWIEIESKSVVDNLPGDLQKKLRRDETIILLSKREGQQVMALYKPT
jgi:5-methylcytosine-specific restriction protein B